MDLPATSDNIPGTLVLRDNSGSITVGPTAINGNLQVGSSAVENFISFIGVEGDNQPPSQHSFIGERKYSVGGESSELLLFKGNDPDGHPAGPDRIRLVGANINLDTYPEGTFLQGSFGDMGASPGPVTRLLIKGNGNVGIGTNTPVAKVDVVGPNLGTTADNVSELLTLRNTNANENKISIFQRRFSNGGNWQTAATRIQSTTDVTPQAYIEFSPDGAGGMSLGTGTPSSERIRIDASGNVGIGTTITNFKATCAHTTTDAAWLHGSGTSSYLSLGGFGNGSDGAFRLNYERTTGATTLSNGTRDTPTERVQIDANGNVGIGTATPAEKLEVNGTVKAAGFSADGIQIDGLSGRNYFRDDEMAGQLRVGAAWGFPGIYSESGRCVMGGEAGVTIEPVGAGNVGIGTGSPNSKAMLDISSTTRGFLPPRMTTTERDAITSPPAGLMVYNSTTNKLNFYNGTAWEAVTSA